MSCALILLLLFIMPVIAAPATPAVHNEHGDNPAHYMAVAYIANSNTGKFHYTSCRWVAKMSLGNKTYYDRRQDAINDGYVPCKVCRP